MKGTKSFPLRIDRCEVGRNVCSPGHPNSAGVIVKVKYGKEVIVRWLKKPKKVEEWNSEELIDLDNLYDRMVQDLGAISLTMNKLASLDRSYIPPPKV